MQLTPAGDRALLVMLGDVSTAELHRNAAALRAAPGVIACVPGHSSVLVVFEGRADRGGVLAAMERVRGGEVRSSKFAVRTEGAPGAESEPRTSSVELRSAPTLHSIPTTFDGPDLDEFLALTSQTHSAFVDRVDALTLTVRYLGFRGGFAYLDGWPAEWAMPRRATSRPVRKGSFGIAGSVAGFYPIDTPGGWNILGHTAEELENRFRAGDEIRITRS